MRRSAINNQIQFDRKWDFHLHYQQKVKSLYFNLLSFIEVFSFWEKLNALTFLRMAGRSGYPKISGRVFRVSGISGFQKCYPKLAGEKKNPKIRVPENSGSGLPEQPEMICFFIYDLICVLQNYVS